MADGGLHFFIVVGFHFLSPFITSESTRIAKALRGFHFIFRMKLQLVPASFYNYPTGGGKLKTNPFRRIIFGLESLLAGLF
jgi:hypothetical protein